MAENKQSQITDKELLAICNLSNLKMEFANVIKSVDTDKITNKKQRKIHSEEGKDDEQTD